MDPDITEQLNEQLKQMGELLGKQNSMMANHLKNLQDQANAGKNFSNSVNNAANNTASAVNRRTLAEEEANRRIKDSSVSFGKALDNSGLAVSSFGRAITNTESSFRKYGDAIGYAGKAASDLLGNFGALGGVAGGVVKGLTSFAGFALGYVDNLVKFRDETTKISGVIPASLEKIGALGAAAGYSGDRLNVLQKITAGLGTSLQGLGGVAGTGVTRFMELAAVSDQVRNKFGKLGINQEELTDLQAKYIQLQTASGLQYQLQNKSMMQLRKESTDYAENMVRLSSLTGKSADQLQKDQDRVEMEFEEQVATLADQQKIRALKSQVGNKAAQEEANQLEASMKARKSIMDNATKILGPELSSQMARVLRTGFFDEKSGPLARLMPELAGYAQQLKNMKPGKEADDMFKRIFSTFQSRVGKDVISLQTALQVGGEGLAKQLGYSSETINKLLTYQGLTLDQLNTKAKEAEKSAEKDKELADLEQQRRDFEIDLQRQLQGPMIELAKIIIPGIVTSLKFLNHEAPTIRGFFTWIGEHLKLAFAWFTDERNTKKLEEAFINIKDGAVWIYDNFKTLAKITGTLIGITALGGLVKTLSTVTGTLGLFRGGLSGVLSILGMAGRAAPVAAEGAAAAGGLGMAGGALKLLGRASPWIAGGMVAKDAYDTATEYARGEKIKKEDLYGTIGGVVGGGIGLLGGPVGVAIGAGIGNMLGNWIGGKADAEERKDTKEKTIKSTAQYQTATSSFEKIIASFGKIVAADGKIVAAFGLNIVTFSKAISEFKDSISSFQLNATDAGAGPGDPNAILSTIRQVESSNNYRAQNSTSTASGAYQFTNPTWKALTKKYGIGTQFNSAKEAPAAIQDQIASARVQEILQQTGGDVSKVPLAWLTGNTAGRSSVVDSSQVSAYQRKWMGIYGQRASTTGNGSNTQIADLGKKLQQAGLMVSEHSMFGGVKGKHTQNSRHYRDMAIDINAPGGIVEANDPYWGGKFDSLAGQLSGAGFNVLWRVPGHEDHMHASVGGPEGRGISAARGGVFTGSKGGYPATLHGTEIVAPVSLNSILMKLAKTPENSPEVEDVLNNITNNNNSNNDAGIDPKLSSHLEVISLKLSNVIDAIEQGNSTRHKILRHTI